MTKSGEQLAKQAAGKAAAELIHDGMLVGLGTGSTAACFIQHLIDRCRNGLQISAVATSERSEQQARAGGIPILDIDSLTSLDIVVDGADEIDHHKRMIKGGGGALLREKIVAYMAREMVVIIDQAKLVEQLGAFPLPVEVAPFAHTVTLHHLQKHCAQAHFRRLPDTSFYITDNGNYIVDMPMEKKISSPEALNQTLLAIPGVLETGFFLNLAGRVLIGLPDGSNQSF